MRVAASDADHGKAIADLVTKFKKAAAMEGFKFMQIDAPCPTNWKSDTADSIKISRLAVQTGIWPLFEWDRDTGKAIISRPSQKYVDEENRLPLTDWTSLQGRTKSITKEQLKNLESDTERQWSFLKKFL